MTDIEALLTKLKSDSEANCALINFVSDHPVHSVAEAGTALLVRGESDRKWVCFYCPDRADFPELCKHLNSGDKHFAMVEDWMLPILGKNKTIKWKMSSQKLVMPLNVPLPAPEHHVQTLGPEHAEYIFAHWPYADVSTPEYTRERLEKGISGGVFDRNKLVAWAATHDDGTLGFMTVLPEYRNRGYALAITLDLIARQRRQGIPSFVHIESENKKSLALALKLGFVSKGNIHWLEYR
ncbi:MAG: GNAT family N-acetyltransferase [Firmicutes bacterium]|nr:GNAT family N-acetyltransferase [Bacillota bacterium]